MKLLHDELKATGTAENPSRVVNISSQVTKWEDMTGAVPFYTYDLILSQDGHYKSWIQARSNSKIAASLWWNNLAFRISKKIDPYDIVVNFFAVSKHNATVSTSN